MPVTLRPNNLLSWRKIDKFAKTPDLRRLRKTFEIKACRPR